MRPRHIDIDKKAVTTQSGKTYNYDFLVIATGSRIRPDNIPGMAEGAHWFYDLDGARKMRDALGGLQGRQGRGEHQCAAQMPSGAARNHLHAARLPRRQGPARQERDHLHLSDRAAARAGAGGKWAVPEFERAGIKSETFFNTKSVDPKAKTITSEEGTTLGYDLLIAIPPHSGQKVITDSNLGAGGWVPTERNTLLREGSNNVFIVGDTTNLPISKAGSTAHFEADTIVDNSPR